jgi:hypothetical protein
LITILDTRPYCPKYSGFFNISSVAIAGGSPTAYTKSLLMTLIFASWDLSLGVSTDNDLLLSTVFSTVPTILDPGPGASKGVASKSADDKFAPDADPAL